MGLKILVNPSLAFEDRSRRSLPGKQTVSREVQFFDKPFKRTTTQSVDCSSSAPAHTTGFFRQGKNFQAGQSVIFNLVFPLSIFGQKDLTSIVQDPGNIKPGTLQRLLVLIC